MKSIAALVILFSGFFVQATVLTYKCNSSGFTKNDGYLNQGFAIVKMNGSLVSFDRYNVNTVAKETTLDDNFVFHITGKNTGNGKVAGYLVGSVDVRMSKYRGDVIGTMYFEEALSHGGYKLRNGKSGGFLAFTGHGFSWDWNLCVLQ